MSNQITVDPRSDARWEALVACSPMGSLFTSPPWIRAVAQGYGLEPSAGMIVDGSGQPRAGLAYVPITDAVGNRIVSLPFSDYSDPLVRDDTDWAALVESLLRSGWPVTLKCLREDGPRRDARFEERGTAFWHETAVAGSEDEQWRQLRGAARRNVRKARGRGVAVSFGDSLEELRAFYELHREVRRRKYHLLAQPWAFFEAMHREFSTTGRMVVLLARLGDRVIGGVVALQWGGTLYYKLNASALDELEVRPNDLLAWEGLGLARRLGCSNFDWGLSDADQPGLIRYKQKFATEERRISILRYAPAGYCNPSGEHLRSVLSDLTRLLTDDSVPEGVRSGAGDLLYRYFA
ncbi:MAG: GNAT family N-acetyltransferase [Dehalococcoidia bacterium]|nr:GNAT family N-acetyltransferase [Dehalococcoidia bacterium]